MWQPNFDGVNEIMKTLEESNSTNNQKQSEVFNKINLYSQSPDFPNYLMFIFIHREVSVEIRQKAGLTLKGLMERSSGNLSEENISFFRQKILENFFDVNNTIKKITSILINCYINLFGIDQWQDLISFLIQNLSNANYYEISMETIQIILEDSGSYIEENYFDHLRFLSQNIISFIESSSKFYTKNSPQNQKMDESTEKKIDTTLSTLHILIDNCVNVIKNDQKKIALTLIKMNQIDNIKIRMRLSYCWNSLVRSNKAIFYEASDELFSFFVLNFKYKDHELDFSSSEFFHHLIDLEENASPPEALQKLMEARIHELIPHIINNMRMDESDICSLENKMKEDKCARDNSIEEEENDYDENLGCDLADKNYSPNWTLRKCSAKILDRFSNLWPKWTIDNTKSFLEIELQNSDWINKEKAILALGALAVGCYELLKPHLSCIIPFLIKELQHPNKFVRAISCWTISRFTRFITLDNLSDNAFELYREYLGEVLKRFSDNENIVQEAAVTAFNVLLITKKEKIEPFLFDVFKIVSNVFKKNYTEPNKKQTNEIVLLNLFEIFSLLTENFQMAFRTEISKDLIEQIFNMWFDHVKIYKLNNGINIKLNNIYEPNGSIFNSNNNNENNLIENEINISNISIIYDMIISYVKAANIYVPYNIILNILEGNLEIMKINLDNYQKEKEKENFNNNNSNSNNNSENNNNNSSIENNSNINKEKRNKININNIFDKDLLTKCFDLLSNIYSSHAGLMQNFEKKNLIVAYVYKFLDLDENYLNHYGIALLGDIARNDKFILKQNLNFIMDVLIKNLEVPNLNMQNPQENQNEIEIERLSICNNSSWTIGILAMSYPDCLKNNIHLILNKFLKIISLPRLNKSLAQNVCISIGRCGQVLPEIISTYLDHFLKQFCLSLRNIKDSPEKEEAFIGLCKSIIHNPNGVINYLAFFCDAICQYQNPNDELERLFQNLIFSFKNTLQEKWFDYFNKFPQRLKNKMTSRFSQA